MTLYLFTFLALLVLAITEALQGNKKMALIGGGFLAVLAGFRYQTGYDFLSYKSFFDDMTGYPGCLQRQLGCGSGLPVPELSLFESGLELLYFLACSSLS